MATVSAIGLSDAISEIDEACRPLGQASLQNDPQAQQEEWFESWKRLAERVEAVARAHEEAGQSISAVGGDPQRQLELPV